METAVIKVDGMSCEHCAKAITNAVGALPGVSHVDVVLKTKTVTVVHENTLSLKKIQGEIEDQGYDIIS